MNRYFIVCWEPVMPLIPRILNGNPSKNTDKDWRFKNALKAGITSDADYPASKDLREPWWDVGDQGQTGSCVGWAIGDGIIRWHLVKAGRIRPNEHLSERYLWMAAKETDDDTDRPTTFIEKAGTTMKSALDVARKFGVVRDSVLPFKASTLYPDTPEDFYSIAAQMKISSYHFLEVNADEWRHWIAFTGPVAARLVIDHTFDDVASDGKLEAYKPYPDGHSRKGGHFVTIVGYYPGHYVIRNSWGVPTWGDNGFGYATERYVSEAFTESYGVGVS